MKNIIFLLLAYSAHVGMYTETIVRLQEEIDKKKSAKT
jgi:hypothetical protein